MNRDKIIAHIAYANRRELEERVVSLELEKQESEEKANQIMVGYELENKHYQEVAEMQDEEINRLLELNKKLSLQIGREIT